MNKENEAIKYWGFSGMWLGSLLNYLVIYNLINLCYAHNTQPHLGLKVLLVLHTLMYSIFAVITLFEARIRIKNNRTHLKTERN